MLNHNGQQIDKNFAEQRRQKRGKALFDMGMVARADIYSFTVHHPQLIDGSKYYIVRDYHGKILCNCEQFKANEGRNFRCEHMHAVKHYLLRQMEAR